MRSSNLTKTSRLTLEHLETRTLLAADGISAPHWSSLVGTAIQDRSTSSIIASPTVSRNVASASTPIVSKLSVNPTINASTVPANGDQNPYGVAFVPKDIARGGKLHASDILVSNFNNSSNKQGTGTTIVDIAPDGSQSLFFQGPAGLGLTTALGVLKRGFMLVGNVPTTDGTFSTIQQGSLLILDKNGNQVANLQDAAKLDGPWDLTVFDQGNRTTVFVSNVLSGTVTRLVLDIPARGNHIEVESSTQIASGYEHRGDPSALPIGPTGLAYDPVRDLLYVASTGDNTIFSISHAATHHSDAGMGQVVHHDDAHCVDRRVSC